jgi:hypothetical protein
VTGSNVLCALLEGYEMAKEVTRRLISASASAFGKQSSHYGPRSAYQLSRFVVTRQRTMWFERYGALPQWEVIVVLWDLINPSSRLTRSTSEVSLGSS